MASFVPPRAPADSFDAAADRVGVGPVGQVGHQALIDHSDTFARTLHVVADGIWTYVGNGLSNQTFVEGPEGIIAIDSGESCEEMANALAALRAHTDAAIVAIIYTHSHYVSGTATIIDEIGHEPPIWGHRAIIDNRREVGLESAPVGGFGLVHQFGMLLPDDGPDALINCGIGPWFQDRANHPHTPGYVVPNQLFDEPTVATVAGLKVVMTPAPSDVSDSITIWFPSLGLCVNNLVWPALFNVFPIRGERFRDPSVLLTGLDEIAAYQAEYLLGCHGPPLTGAARIQEVVTRYRDAIQYLLDQTVRAINKGLTLDEVSQRVTLPAPYGDDYFTAQLYGLAEHHVKQIYTGLRGWFDGDAARLFPVPPIERANRLIDGFGGPAEVRAQIDRALQANDLRWALELATWLVKREADATGRADGGDPADRARLAAVLRTIGQRTMSANVRNWCLTRARELEGVLNLDRFRLHRFRVGAVLAAEPADSVRALRVVFRPEACPAEPCELVWRFRDGSTVGLVQRNGVAVPTDGDSGAPHITLDHSTWAAVLAGKQPLSEAVASGEIVASDPAFATEFLSRFEVAGLHA